MLGLSANLNYSCHLGKFKKPASSSKKPVFDEVSKCYRIQWSDMAYLSWKVQEIVVDKMYVGVRTELVLHTLIILKMIIKK